MRDHIEDILTSGLLERYVLGDVTPQERMKVDLLRIEHRAIREELERLEIVMEKTALENAIPAPPKAKECIIRSINKDVSASATNDLPAKRSLFQSSWKIAAAFALSGIMTWMLMQSRINSLTNTNSELTVELDRLEQACERLSAQYAFLNDSSTIPVLLEGTSQAPESQVVVYWNEMKEQSMIKVINLPSIRADQTYQLWADVEGQMLSLGTFDAALAIVDPMPMEYLSDAESLNITIEPKGGSEHPTVSTLTASQLI